MFEEQENIHYNKLVLLKLNVDGIPEAFSFLAGVLLDYVSAKYE